MKSKQRQPKKEDLVSGQILTYVGKGFIGYKKDNTLMKFIKVDERGMFDIWVEYIAEKRIEMLVRIDEVSI